MGYDSSIVPVLMFHSVGLSDSDWVYSYLSDSLDGFEERLRALAESGHRTVHWDELFHYMSGKRTLPAKSIMLTFDDGYLDNWVYVFPLAKRYGMKFTVFVNPEFVDPTLFPRLTLEEVWSNRLQMNDLRAKGFLSWEEMRIMLSSGLVDIQSHTLTHTWYFAGPEVIDFHRPELKEYPWLAWNAKPEQKPFYMARDQSGLVPWGTPIYENERALICKRYFPAEAVEKEVCEFVEREGGQAFFHKDGWRNRLLEVHCLSMQRYGADCRYEDDDSHRDRIYGELMRSKEILELKLRKSVDFVCWPGGAYDAQVVSLGKKAGYKAWTLSSKDESDSRNRPNSDPSKIKRLSPASTYALRGKSYGQAGKYYFLAGIDRHKGSLLSKWFGRLLLFFTIIRHLTAR